MFNNDVSQTYNFQDASQEIIIMLLGAFLFGCLITWLLSKLFNKDYTIENEPYKIDHLDDELGNESKSLSKPHISKSYTKGGIRDTNNSPNMAIGSANTDDLTKISGVNSDIQTQLNAANISTFAELRDIKSKDLMALQNKLPTLNLEMETWSHQASLASKGDWNKLEEYQNLIKRAQLASNTSQKSSIEGDDLTKLEGVTPDIEKILNKNDITTFKQLSLMDSNALTNHIRTEDSHFIESDAESWSHQAAMADKGQWEELRIYQEFMHSDSELSSKSSINNSSIDDSSNNNESTQESEFPSNSLNEKNLTPEINHSDKDSNTVENTLEENQAQDPDDVYENSDENLSDHDDLRKIQGISPAIEDVLNQGGIYTFSQLYNSDRTRIRSLLDDAGSQFKMHDPESWPHQAGMANRKEWKELKSYQKLISSDLNSTKSEVTDISGKRNNNLSIAHPKDDLTKIEGIGPKIQEVLNDSGIYTYKSLSKSDSASIKASLDEAGPQFRMHDPETWPQQALLASQSEWDELASYQDKIIDDRANKARQAINPSNSSNVTSMTQNKANIDDLKRIEGIGPKINELLNNAGIYTFEQLSKQSRDYIKELLNAAGPQFRMHEPESWPHQAKLAANGEWDDLEKYQDFLQGGRE